MSKEREYMNVAVEVILFDFEDVIKTSTPVGEDGNDIFDDR